MGTHPIFESDFDCLTENLKKCRKSPVPAGLQKPPQIKSNNKARVFKNCPKGINSAWRINSSKPSKMSNSMHRSWLELRSSSLQSNLKLIVSARTLRKLLKYKLT